MAEALAPSGVARLLLWLRSLQGLRPLQRLRLPQDGPQRTALQAILAASLLILLLAVVAHGCTSPTVPFQMERYVKLGPRQGPISLRQDLLAAHGATPALGGVVSQLSRMGFTCPGTLPEEPMLCRFRARRPDGQVATLLVEIRHDGQVAQAIATRMELGLR